MTGWLSTFSIPPPYKIVIELGASPNTPINYADWSWATESKCDNILYGVPVAAGSEDTDPTMKLTTGFCKASGRFLTFSVNNTV